MPFISDAASAIKSRFGFNDHSADPARTTPSVAKSASRDNLILAQASAFRSVRDCFDNDSDGDEDGDRNAASSSQCFEFSEDPAFWKDHNVQVIIRIRPLSNAEISLQGYGKCVCQESSQTITWTGPPDSRFTFDLVADENVSQENLFKVAGVPMVDNCMEGYNSCMFAYGQTGSGKTHTMLGDIEGGTRRHSVNCGMTPRVFEYLFTRIQKDKEARRDEKLKFACKCSFLEIYNEQILDLLDPSSINLQLREDVKKGVYVENLKEVEVTTARDVMQQLIEGAANRKVAATNMNRASSRSHSVFTCVIESKWESQGVTHHRFARLNLVDLAGSERQKSSGAEGERLKEATNINKSLSTLGLVIMNLVNISNGKSLHVPYRDSKLTFLLQDSLGGNSKTIIISNISPSSCCSLETLSTLKFAQRAKFIKNNAIINEDASGDVISMRIQIQQLKKEVSRLQGLVSHDNDILAVSFPGSPGAFKWEGPNGSFSPLISGKRMSQKKDYEVALVGAFKREKDKDIALQALAAENQAAMQLAREREDEIQGLKMRLRFREAGIKRLEAVASGKISAETHLLKEKEEHLKEIEVLRTQVNRNQDVTRFAMENLRLKEEIRRLKSFYEEGERETMNEQVMVLQNKLLEALDWKLMHESDSSKKANSNVVIEELSEDDFLISNKEPQFPWRTSINEENEFLRMQAIQNQAEMDTLRKKLELCLEAKEKSERDVNDLETKLEVEPPSLPPHVPINLSDQMELKAMVDAIAAASQREAEAHESAIMLSRENDELRMKLKVLIEDNNKLIELYESASAECNNRAVDECKIAEGGSKIQSSINVELAQEREAETNKVENLAQQLMEMHEENEKLMGLYESAMRERDELKRMLSVDGEKSVAVKREFDCVEKVVEVDEDLGFDAQHGEQAHNFEKKPTEFEEVKSLVKESSSVDTTMQDRLSLTPPDIDMCMEEINDSMLNHDTTGLSLASPQQHSGNLIGIGTTLTVEIQPLNHITAKVSEDLNLAWMKLERADKQLVDSSSAMTLFCSLEKLVMEMSKLSGEIEIMEETIQEKQQLFESVKLHSSEIQQKRALIQKKLSALKYSLLSFSSSVAYFEQREARATSRVDASTLSLEQKKKELAHLQAKKNEIQVFLSKNQQSEAELSNHLSCLMLKLDEENRKQENDKVLFSIDNIDKMDPAQKNWHLGGRATELLKSEEEKTKLQAEVKISRETLGAIRKKLEDLKRKSAKVDVAMVAVEMEFQKRSKSAEEAEVALQNVQHDKNMLLEMRDNGNAEIGSMVIEYQQHLFEADLTEAEMEELEDELRVEIQRTEELRKAKAVAAEKTRELLDIDSDHMSYISSEKVEEELESVRTLVVEAKHLLEGSLNRF